MVKSSENISEEFPWKMQYDSTMQQYYYVNTKDNTVSFDLPCEVSHKKESSKQKSFFNLKRKNTQESQCQMSRSDSGKKRNVLSKIGSVLSIRSSKSHESNDDSPISPITSGTKAFASKRSSDDYIINGNYKITPYDKVDNDEDTTSILTRIDDEYLLDNPANFKNFAGTSINYYESDLESVSSSESIQSYYSDLNSYYYQSENEGSTRDLNLSFDKDEERRQLRLQMLQELEI